MKKPFNNQGVADFQQELFAAPADFRLLQIQRVRCDFKNFILDFFEFKESQLLQISNMTVEFATVLGAAIADTWVLGQPVNFQKESPLTQKDAKDIILSDTNSTIAGPALIQIRYSSLRAPCPYSEPDPAAAGKAQKLRLA